MLDKGNQQHHYDDRYFDALLEGLLCKLLKFRIQRGFRNVMQAREIELLKVKLTDLIQQNGWLNVRVMHQFCNLYHYARLQAMIDTGFKDSSFPEECPWRVQDILRVDYFQI